MEKGIKVIIGLFSLIILNSCNQDFKCEYVFQDSDNKNYSVAPYKFRNSIDIGDTVLLMSDYLADCTYVFKTNNLYDIFDDGIVKGTEGETKNRYNMETNESSTISKKFLAKRIK